MEGRYVIRCPIHGNIACNQLERDLIEHPYFQRLRHISQLGLVDFVYPSANHNRFSHTLGVMHLAGTFFDWLFAGSSLELPAPKLAFFRQALRVTALVHDLGHLPFSHVLEDFFPPASSNKNFLRRLKLDLKGAEADQPLTHEHFSELLLLDLTDKKLVPEEIAAAAAALLSGNKPASDLFQVQGVDYFPALRCLISSSLDVDRMDYLLRDAFFAGVAYGKYDWQQILQSLRLYPNENQVYLCLHTKGLLAYQDFLLARENMFFQVYYHKSLLSLVEVLKQAFRQQEMSLNIFADLESYSCFNDHSLWSLMQERQHLPFTHAVYHRRIWKTVLRLYNPTDSEQALAKDLHGALSSNGVFVLQIEKMIYNQNKGLDVWFDPKDYSKKIQPLSTTSLPSIYGFRDHRLLQLILDPKDQPFALSLLRKMSEKKAS